MKRIISLMLALLLLISLVSCSSEKEKKDPVGGMEKDLASLNATEFYGKAVEKNKNLKSAYYKTKVILNDAEVFVIETRRVRGGYEGYDYSRIGREELIFFGSTAYISGELGKFAAPATGRSFDQYLEEFVYPVFGVNPERFFEATREKNTVSYTVTAKDVFSLYNNVLKKDEFVARSMKGVATMTDEAVLTKEVITLTGTGRDGTEATLVLETTLSALRDESIKVEGPKNPEAYVSLTDIRLPEKILGAVEKLYAQGSLQATLVSSNTVSCEGKTYAFYQDTTFYQLETNAGTGAYLSKQSLKQLPDLPEESLFYQILVKDGKSTENQYNLISGELLSESKDGENTVSIQSEVKEIMPVISDFATLTMDEDLGGYSILFTLSEKAAKNIFEKVVGLLPQCGKTADLYALKECQGTLSVSKETGLLTSLTYTVTGSIPDTEGESVVGRYSFLLDSTEDITLPELQSPTATVPGQGA